ncbi:MAG: Endonuclease V [Candidatus Thorarchaeota archaeon]|nr:MAG: Endonuclease V [Candidatus Thorarchaeota archaeon]
MKSYPEEMLKTFKAQQEQLAKYVVTEDMPEFTRGPVTGIDVTYRENLAVVCLVTIDSDKLKITRIEKQVLETKVPYISGCFYLKEGPLLKQILADIDDTGPIMIDANGMLHPRRLGIASQIGVELDRQTIGVAKNLHIGIIGTREGNTAPITSKEKKEILGMAVWIERKSKPLIVSIGHRISLPTAVSIVRMVSNKFGPIPLLLADRYSRETIAKITDNQ